MLEISGLVKHYHVGDDEPIRAVDYLSLFIAPGELVALYGPSGSGKTTLLMLIAALLPPDAGKVIVNGRDLASLSDSEQSSYRLRELGLIDQTFDLLPGGTVLQNAALKLWMLENTRAAERRMRPLLERLGLGERLHHRADQLSVGERQRVMIARALSTHPKLVLADEPTGNLDTRRGREVLELLSQACREHGTSVLLVTHDPQATAFADRVLALRDGRLTPLQEDALVPAEHQGEVIGQ
ncbi:MAG: ABC transporter ATP-binding protein [Solirubrobacteraceae bacterium]